MRRNITLNFEVNAQAKKNGTFPIFLRVTQDGSHFKMVTQAYVTNRKHFNAKAPANGWIATKEPMAKVFNTHLSDTLEQAYRTMNALQQQNELTAQSLIKTLKQGNPHSVLAFIERKKTLCKAMARVSSYEMLTNIGRKLEKFTHGKELTFDQITHTFLLDFIAFLSQSRARSTKPISPNTIYNHIHHLKTLYKQAELENLVDSRPNPFQHIKVKKEKTHKTSLSQDDLGQMIGLELEPQSSEWHARNYFLFALYAAGMRIGDVIRLRWQSIQEGRLVYKMQKTGATRSLPITEQIEHILKLYRNGPITPTQYVFPILTPKDMLLDPFRLAIRADTHLSLINKRLRAIAQQAGVTKRISFHIARHTFASMAAEQGSVYQVSQLLGHSSIAITQTYLHDINPKAQDEFMNNLSKSIFMTKKQ